MPDIRGFVDRHPLALILIVGVAIRLGAPILLLCMLIGVVVALLQAVTQKFGNCFNPTDFYGEDLAFCWRVGQIGREIWCEPTVRPGHIAHIPVYAGEDLFGTTTEQERE